MANIFSKFKSWFAGRKKRRTSRLSDTVRTAPSRPTRQTSYTRESTSSSSSGGGRRSYTETATRRSEPVRAVGYRPKEKKETVKAKSTQKPEKRISVADVMKAVKPTESTFDKARKAKSDLTAREQALKRRVQQTTHVVGNRVGNDFAKDVKSGIYNVKATKKEKANVAKSIEKDYNKKKGAQRVVAGITKSDANVRIATKAITGKKIDTSKVTKSKGYKGGDIAQEVASYAIAPTSAVEKGLAKAGAKALAKKALKKEGKELTKEAIAKASKTAAKELSENKVKTFARKRAADTIANAGFNAKYAADRARDEKSGKVNKKEALKDFAINTGLDIGIGSGIDAVKGVRAARKAKKTTALVPQKIAGKKETQKLLATTEKKALPEKKAQKLLASQKLKELPEPKKQEFKGLTAEEEKSVRKEIRKRAAEKKRRAQEAREYEAAERQYNKEREPLTKFDAEDRDADLSRLDKKRFGKTVEEDYQDRLNLARSKGKTKTAQERGYKAARKTSRYYGIKDGVTTDQNPELRKAIDNYIKHGDEDSLYREARKQMEDAVGARTKRTYRRFDKRTKSGKEALARGEKAWGIYYDEHTYRELGASDKDLDRLAENYVDQVKKDLAKAEPKAGKNIKPKKWKTKLADTDKVYDESPSGQELHDLFKQKQPRGKKVKGTAGKAKDRIEARAKAEADATAKRLEGMSQNEIIRERHNFVKELREAHKIKDATAQEKAIANIEKRMKPYDEALDKISNGERPKAGVGAEEPTSTIRAEKKAEPTNAPTAEKEQPKQPENGYADLKNFYEDDAQELVTRADTAKETLRKNAEAEDLEKARMGAGDYDPLTDLVNEAADREPGIHLPGTFKEPERAQAALNARKARTEATEQAEADLIDATLKQNKEAELAASRQASKERTAKMDEALRGNKAEAPKAEAPKETVKETPKETDSIRDKIGRPEKRSRQAKLNNITTDLRRKFINSLGFSEREAEKYAKEIENPEFAATFKGNANNMRQSMQRAMNSFADVQQDFAGNEVGDSFRTIAKDINAKGAEHYSNTEEYVFLLNHADRMDNAANKELDKLVKEYQKIEKDIASGKIGAKKGETMLNDLSDRMDEVEGLGLDDSRANKRLFDNLTAKEARAKAQAILDADPEVAKDADRIIQYFRNDLRSQVQAGLISEDTFRHYMNVYPNYVPAHRAFEKAGYNIAGDATKLRPEELRAVGSGRKLLPIEDQAMMSAEYTFTRGAQNELSKQIAEMSGYSPRLLDVYEDADGVNALDLATFYDFEHGKLQFWDNGKMRSVSVPENFLKDLRDMQINSVQAEGLNGVLKTLGTGNRVFKELITSYNPAFLIKNGFRDIPEGAFQSQNMGTYLKNLASGRGAMSILSNDEWYKAYKRMGGQHSQFISSAEDIFKDKNWFAKNTFGRIEAANEFMEQIPRMSEFIGFLEKRGKTPATATADERRQAAEAAADVTVNFGRSGSIGRIINSNLVPFFNPAMQGWSKITRVLTKDKSVKGYLNLIAKVGALGVAPAALNEWMLRDNENYQLINERDRAVNYYIPLDADNPFNKMFGSTKSGVKDGEVFLKIPKARFLSVMGMGTQKAMGTTDIPWGDIVSISSDQIGPVGWSNNIFGQLKNSAITNDKAKGQTWYGADIETDYDQKNLPKDRYDANTSGIAIKLGELTGKSPKKIDYLIDSYTGVIGDIALPATRKAAGRSGGGVGGAIQGYLGKNFSTDTVSQNNLTTKMYDRINELTQKKNGGDTSGKTEYGLWYLNNRSKEASKIRKEIRAIQNSSKSKNEKAKEIRPLQRELNKLTKTGMDTEKAFVKEAKKRIANLKDTDLSAKTQQKYGLENAMIATAEARGEDPWKLVNKAFSQAKNRKKMSPYAKKAGMDPVKFKEFYNIKAYDLDKSGYANKSEAIAYLNSRDDLTGQEKAILFAGINKLFTKSGNPYGDVGGDGNTKTASAYSGRRRYRRRYGRRRYGRRYSSKGKASGPQKAPAKIKLTQAEKTASASSVMRASTPSNSAKENLIKKTTGNAYANAVKSVQSKKSKKDVYKIKAKKV